MDKTKTWTGPFIVFFGITLAVVLLLYYYENTSNYWHYLLWVAFCYYIFQTILTLTISASTRNTNTKISWLVFSLVIPVIGPLLYFIFGRRYKHRLNLKQYIAKNQWWREVQQPSSCDAKISASTKSEFEQISKLTKKNYHNVEVDFHFGGEEAFSKLFKAIREAKEEIDIEIFIMKPGEIYEMIKELLVKKAQSGVKVRIIIDDFGRWALPYFEVKELRKAGIEITIYGKTHFPFIGAENGYRLHRKFVLIDNKKVITGGLNFADEYAHYSKRFGYWLDLNYELKGDIVQEFRNLFASDWYRIGGEKLKLQTKTNLKIKPQAKSSAILVESGPDNNYSYPVNSITNLIQQAKKRVWISTPYLAPTEGILKAIESAAIRGVDVRIFIPGKYDKWSVNNANSFFSKDLAAKYGVKIFETNDIFIHSKLGLFDDIGLAGTVNLDIRSFYSQFELMNFFVGEASEKIAEIFKEYEFISTQANYTNFVKHSLWVRFKQGILMVVLPLM